MTQLADRGQGNPTKRRAFTSEQILERIHAWNAGYGAPPTTKDWEPSRALAAGQAWRAERYAEGDWPSLGMVQRRFGTFNHAIREAGFEPRPVRASTLMDSSRDRILRLIVEWTRRYGAPPTQSDWDPPRARRSGQHWRAVRFEDGDWPRLSTVRRNFGSLRQAVEAVGLRARRPGEHGRTEFADRSHNLHAVAAFSDHGGSAGSPRADLAAAVRDVVAARRSGDHDLERRALLDLASTALSLADDIGWRCEERSDQAHAAGA